MNGIYKKVFVSIAISFSVIILFQFFYSFSVGINVFLSKKFILGIFILILIYLIDSLRLKLLLCFFGYKIPFFETVRNVFFGKFFSFITPMSIGGQPYQIYHLSKIGVKTEDATNIIISRTLEISIVILALDLIFVKPILNAYPKSIGFTLIVVGFLVSLGVSILIFLGFVNRKFLEKILLFFGRIFKKRMEKDKILKWIDSLHESINILWVKNPWMLFFDIILYFLTICMYGFILYMFVVNINFWYIIGVLALLNSVAYYIPTPGSSGGIEGTYQLVFSQIFGGNKAIELITIYRIITFYFPLILGTLLFPKFGFNYQNKEEG
ncbi:lysylphosphatidylglycerol synthase transmembrane domain-containing protein [Thermosipho sp. 1070]|uniref:lysylphosphatidylglycerol synthase transmembrane domain-containing protein n=1 Tax=Thermosipho sp. 1070 TaxID=1437364 RepID=UPI000B4B410E|nr:lysylphosphatidylglycerol synthase transmembrane domain-containing protein [Thermosipho sp. 1070]